MTRAPQIPTVRRRAALAAAACLTATLSACGGDAEPQRAESRESAPSTQADDPASTDPDPSGAPPPADDEPFGPECGKFDTPTGVSVDEVDDMPVRLFLYQPAFRDASTLLGRSGLFEDEGRTFFVPTTEAIDNLPYTQRANLSTDPEKLRAVMSRHVLPKQLTPSLLAGEHETLDAGTLEVSVDGEDIGVGIQGASVVCGNIQTEDGIVYVIDQLLLS